MFDWSKSKVSDDVKHSWGNLYCRFSRKSRAGRKANVLANVYTRLVPLDCSIPTLFLFLLGEPGYATPPIENRRRCRHRRRCDNRVWPVDTTSWNWRRGEWDESTLRMSRLLYQIISFCDRIKKKSLWSSVTFVCNVYPTIDNTTAFIFRQSFEKKRERKIERENHQTKLFLPYKSHPLEFLFSRE